MTLKLITCLGKGGLYRHVGLVPQTEWVDDPQEVGLTLVGLATGAGTRRSWHIRVCLSEEGCYHYMVASGEELPPFEVYQDVTSKTLYFRDREDFRERMAEVTSSDLQGENGE